MSQAHLPRDYSPSFPHLQFRQPKFPLYTTCPQNEDRLQFQPAVLHRQPNKRLHHTLPAPSSVYRVRAPNYSPPPRYLDDRKPVHPPSPTPRPTSPPPSKTDPPLPSSGPLGTPSHREPAASR